MCLFLVGDFYGFYNRESPLNYHWENMFYLFKHQANLRKDEHKMVDEQYTVHHLAGGSLVSAKDANQEWHGSTKAAIYFRLSSTTKIRFGQENGENFDDLSPIESLLGFKNHVGPRPTPAYVVVRTTRLDVAALGPSFGSPRNNKDEIRV